MRQLVLILVCASNAFAAVDAGFDGDDGIYTRRKASSDELEAPSPAVTLSFDVDQYGDNPDGTVFGSWPAILHLRASLGGAAKQATLRAAQLTLRLTDKTGASIDWKLRAMPQNVTRFVLDQEHASGHLEWALEETSPSLVPGRFWVTAKWGTFEMPPIPIRVVLPPTPLSNDEQRRLEALRIRIARKLHEIDRARTLANEALAMNPDDPTALVDVAETALEAGDLAAARKAADQGERLESTPSKGRGRANGSSLEATDPSPLWHDLRNRINAAEALERGKRR